MNISAWTALQNGSVTCVTCPDLSSDLAAVLALLEDSQLCYGPGKHGRNDCSEGTEDFISRDEKLMRCANSFLELSG